MILMNCHFKDHILFGYMYVNTFFKKNLYY